MKLSHFHAWQHTEPHVTQLEKPTKDFMIKDAGGTEWIDVNGNGTLIIIRRARLPDLVFTTMGYGTLLGDGTVPGARSGNPEDEEPEQRGKKGKR